MYNKPMDYDDFLKKQNIIYGEIGDYSLRLLKEGIHSKISEKQVAGYLIICRHSIKIAQLVHEFSMKINKLIPSTLYIPKKVHTTISTIPVDHDNKNTDILKKAISSVAQERPFKITFHKWLVAKDAIIAAGTPDEQFFRIVDMIKRTAAKDGLFLRYPKMAHITTARFKEICTDRVKLKKLLELVNKQKPLGVSRINKIEAAYIKHGEADFEGLERIEQVLK